MGSVHTLYSLNARDAPAALRLLADSIERGDRGDVSCVGVVILGDTVEVFGMGEDAEAPMVALLLHAGHARLSRQLQDHGR